MCRHCKKINFGGHTRDDIIDVCGHKAGGTFKLNSSTLVVSRDTACPYADTESWVMAKEECVSYENKR